MTFVDNKVALRQLEQANAELVARDADHAYDGQSIALDDGFHPRVLTLVKLLCRALS